MKQRLLSTEARGFPIITSQGEETDLLQEAYDGKEV